VQVAQVEPVTLEAVQVTVVLLLNGLLQLQQLVVRVYQLYQTQERAAAAGVDRALPGIWVATVVHMVALVAAVAITHPTLVHSPAELESRGLLYSHTHPPISSLCSRSKLC
jgi:hypothetical protein